MPSFDIVSRVEMQNVDDAVNNTRKEIATRYDFRNSHSDITLDRKEKKILCVTTDKMKMEAMREIFLTHAVKRKLNLKSLKFEEPQPAASGSLRREIKIQEGLDREVAREIVGLIKATKLKVQASIQGDEVRVSGKQIDDLQVVMAKLNEANLPVPLQFINVKR